MFRQKALGVELHADDRQRSVPDGHDFPAAVGRFGPGGNEEIRVQRIGTDDEAVVARGGERVWQPLEDPLAVVVDLVGLPMHQPLGPHDDAAGRLADGLMPQANAKQRQLAHELLNALDRNAGLARRAGPRRNDQMARFLGRNFVRGDLVVPMDFDFQPGINFPQPLHEVVGEGVVVVDKQNHGRRTSLRGGGELILSDSLACGGCEWS